jgi:hypothetical protein
MKKRISAIITILLTIGMLVAAVGCSKTTTASSTDLTTSTTTVSTTADKTTNSTTTPTLDQDSTITIMDAPGSILKNNQNLPSEVLLQTVEINKGVSDKHYSGSQWVNTVINPGDPVFLVAGVVQNLHPVNKYIAIWALGYDGQGNQMAGSVDCSYICGQILLQGGTGETGEFTLHLNYVENMKTVRIFAITYAAPPP